MLSKREVGVIAARVAAVCFAVLAVGGLVPSTATAAPGRQAAEQDAAATYYYFFPARHSGKLASAPDLSTTNGDQLIQLPKSAGSWNSQWEHKVIEVDSQGLGWYQFRTRYSRQCMDVQNHSTAKNAPVIQQTCDPNSYSQQWATVSCTQDGWCHFQNRNSGLVLNVSGASTKTGAPLIQWPQANGDTNAQFRWESAGQA